MTAVRKKTETYHHGNLKQALLEAAKALAQEMGVDNFTLREVARRAGVSPAAPYHHFADKNDLVRGLALQAFEQLTQTLTEAKNSQSGAYAQLEAIGLAYVRFSLEHANEFRFMFRRELCAPLGQPDPLQEAGRASQAVLEQTILEGQATGQLKATAPQTCGLLLWSVVHGLAGILLETPFGKHIEPTMVFPMVSQVIRQSLEALITP